MHVHLAERHVAHEVQAEHDHARDPEEDDVEARDQHRGRIERRKLGRLGRPAQRRVRPQRGGEPRVEHVVVLAQRDVPAMPGLGLRLGAGLVACDVDRTVLVVPGRDPVTPPQLAADAPVLDAAHPLEVGAVPVLRHEADATILHRADRRLRQRRDAHVPLVGQPRLDDRVAAVAPRNLQRVRVGALDQPARLEQREYLAARVLARQSAQRDGDRLERRLRHRIVAVGGGQDRRVLVEHVQHRQRVALAEFVVVEVVRRRDLDAAGTELRIDIGVGHDRHQATRDRQAYRAADEMAVALVIRMHGHGRVTEHRLRARGGHHQLRAAVLERVAQVPQAAFLLRRQHLQVRQRRVQHRVPVHQPLAAVDQALLVQPHERLGHRLRQARVHREALATPVHACAEAAQLARDRAAGLLLPFPHALDERLATQVVARQALGVELAFHDHLRGDAGVIGSRLPQRPVAAHAVVARQPVHDRVLERMSHVQRAGHVRRRDHDAVRRAVAAGLETAVGLPLLVQAGLDLAGRVGLRHAARVGRFARHFRFLHGGGSSVRWMKV